MGVEQDTLYKKICEAISKNPPIGEINNVILVWTDSNFSTKNNVYTVLSNCVKVKV